MPAVTNGAKLVKLLIESGTPPGLEGPLASARVCLSRVHASEGRVATAAEVVTALVESLGEDHGTAIKAQNLLATGSASMIPVGDARPIEDRLVEPEPDTDAKLEAAQTDGPKKVTLKQPKT